MIHWVPAHACVPVEVRLYDRLFAVPDPDADSGSDFTTFLNPDSLAIGEALAEPALANGESGAAFQFERVGYFAVDPDSTPERPVFNRVVALRDSWKPGT